MTWVNVTTVRYGYNSRAHSITVGIVVPKESKPRICFGFAIAAAKLLKLKPGNVDIMVGQASDAGFCKFIFDRPNGSTRLIKSSGHEISGLRISSSLWDGIRGVKGRFPVEQAYWDAAKRILVLALPDALTGVVTRHRNDLGAELGLV